MASISKVAILVAGTHFAALVALASPSTAFAQATPQPAAPPLTAPMPAAVPTAAPVWVHLEGSDVAELQQDTLGDHRHWVTVCSAPCNKAVSPQFSYRISGDGIRSSRVFTLDGSDRETITVDESSKTAFVAGIVGASVGGLCMFIGAFVALIGALESGIGDTLSSTPSNAGDSTEEVGGVLVVVGVAGVIAGVVGLVSSVHSGVTQRSVTSQGAWLPPSSDWASAPAFRGALKDALPDSRHTAAAAAALPPILGVPLFGGHF